MDFFTTAYRGRLPGDTPRKEFALPARQGEITGSVLDTGCGTGDNAHFSASEGHEVVGIDAVPAAIGTAQARAGIAASPAADRSLRAAVCAAAEIIGIPAALPRSARGIALPVPVAAGTIAGRARDGLRCRGTEGDLW
jgi:SAM-dependent methyltransferase